MSKREKQAMADAEVTMTKAEFEAKFPVGHMRRAVSKGEFAYFGYYAFLDPSNNKRTFVQ